MRSSIQRRTFAWPIFSVTCLSNSCSMLQRVGGAAVDAGERDRAAAADEFDRQVERAQPVDAGVLISRRATASGSRPASFCAIAAPVAPCASMPTASMTASGPRPPVSSRTASTMSRRVADVERVHAVRVRRARAARARDRARSRGSAPRCWAIRVAISPIGPRPITATLPPCGSLRVLDRLPRGRQDVGEEQEAVVGRAVGHLDRAVLRLRHAQELGLAARAPGRRASCSRTARRPCPARAPASSRTATAARGRTSSSARRRC